MWSQKRQVNTLVKHACYINVMLAMSENTAWLWVRDPSCLQAFPLLPVRGCVPRPSEYRGFSLVWYDRHQANTQAAPVMCEAWHRCLHTIDLTSCSNNRVRQKFSCPFRDGVGAGIPGLVTSLHSHPSRKPCLRIGRGLRERAGKEGGEGWGRERERKCRRSFVPCPPS